MNIMFLLTALIINLFINAVIFWLLSDREINFFQAIKLTSVIGAMNKLLLTGSGYLAMTWKLKEYDFPVTKSIPVFSLFELVSLAPWLVSGFYFGAKAAIKIPVFFIVGAAIILIFTLFKIKKAKEFLIESLNYLKKIIPNIPLIIPLILVNVSLSLAYYYFLFGSFGIVFSIWEVFRMVSIAITIGYLSPSPSGLGFKEGSLVFLLMQNNISLKSSISIAIADRLIVTILYAVLGLFFGWGMFKNNLKSRFNIRYFENSRKLS